jgi:hypothetical protein
MLLILQSVVAVGVASLMAAVRRTAATVAGLLIAAALALTSLGFFTMAMYRALCRPLGDVYSLLIVGTAYFVACLIALLILHLKQR